MGRRKRRQQGGKDKHGARNEQKSSKTRESLLDRVLKNRKERADDFAFDPIAADFAFRCACVRSGHLQGNFPKYYEFNPIRFRMKHVEDLKRMGAFASVTKKIETLVDIGCNTGDLTRALHRELGAKKSVGVDIDKELIARANSIGSGTNGFDGIRFVVGNAAEKGGVPRALRTLSPQPAPTFDVVTCFGTTMWIHIHYGDRGLVHFLKSLANLSGAYILLESQIWKCYGRARTRMRKIGVAIPEAFETIEIRGDEALEERIDEVFRKCGFLRWQAGGASGSEAGNDAKKTAITTGRTEWNRTIRLYRRAEVRVASGDR